MLTQIQQTISRYKAARLIRKHGIEAVVSALAAEYVNTRWVIDNPYYGKCTVEIVSVGETPFVGDSVDFRACAVEVDNRFIDYLPVYLSL